MAMVAWTAASAVTSGASLLFNMAGAPEFSIVCTIVIENRTKYPLISPEAYIDAGEMKSPPVVVRPGHRESFIAHKVSNSVAGSAGMASWLIKGLEKRVAVMWSCPYSRTLCKNWLGVGLTEYAIEERGANLYKHMFEGGVGPRLDFARRDYYNSMHTLSRTDNTIRVTGIMGTSEKPTINIIVEALHENN